MNDRIGIIGAGTIAEAYYLPALRQLGFADIVLNDLDTDAAAAVAGKHRLQTATLSELIESSAILMIATPPHTHFELLNQCIAAGNKTVICEKPFLFSKQEALTVIELAQQYSSTVKVAHIRRVFTAIHHAANLIPTLNLGRLKKAELWEGGRFAYKPKSDYTTQNIYGGVLLDTGSHVLDCLLYVTGLTRVPLNCQVQQVKRDKPEPSHEVSYSFYLNDIAVSLNLSRYQVLANKMTLYYESGTVEIPLGLKPNFVVTTGGKRKIVSSEQSCFNYMTEAFKAEFYKMLVEKDQHLFDAADFVNLTSILETLYHA